MWYLVCMDMLSMLVSMLRSSSIYRDSVYRGGGDLDGAGGPCQGLIYPTDMPRNLMVSYSC